MSLSIPIYSISLMLIKFLVIFSVSFAVIALVSRYVPEKFKPYKKYAYAFVFLFLLFYMVIFPVLGGLHQPKLTIDHIVKQEQIEYNRPKDVTITTPEPRTKKLEGFDKDESF